MRLHSLEITGFGPFAGTERIDFDELCSDGLFLLHGQTGSGKTTVLDAVAFALYGTVPGARKDGRRLRSDHAAADVRTEVILEATIGGRTLRIRRSPEYMRPKRRGTGHTKEQARVTLEWLDGTGENVSRIPDVAGVVLRLLGMSAEQFFQVVLLPQGEFARFLQADTGTRAELLEKLFDTGRFGSVEAWFAQRRRDGAAKAEDARRAVDVATANLATAAGEDLVARAGHVEPDGGSAPGERTVGTPPAPQSDGAPAAVSGVPATAGSGRDDAAAPSREDDPVAWADAVRACAGSAAERAERDLTAARAESQEERRCADRDRERARAQRRRREALQAVADHEDGRAARERAAHERDAARRAEQAGWAERARIEVDQERELTAARATSARDAFMAAGPEAHDVLAAAESAGDVAPADSGRRGEPVAFDASMLSRTGREWDAELVRLDAAAEDEQVLIRLREDYRRGQEAAAELAGRAEANAQRMEGLPDRITEARDELDRADEAARGLDGLRSALDAASSVEAAAQAVPAAVTARVEADERVMAAQQEYNLARGQALDLREKRLDGMAAELAGELRADEPCLVCGSDAHPRPARHASGPVTKEDEDAADRAVAAAAHDVEERRRALHDAETELALHRQRSGDLDSAGATARRKAAAGALADAERLASGRDDAAARLGRLQSESQSAQAEADELAEKRGQADKSLAGLQARIADTRVRLADVAGRDSAVRERSEHVRALRGKLDEFLEAYAEWDTARQALAKARQAVQVAAHEGGFEDVDSALAAVRPAGRCEEVDAGLAAAREAVASARAVLDEPDVAAEDGADPVDAEASAAAAAAAERRLEAAVRGQNAASTRLAAVAEQYAHVHQAVRALGPVLEEQQWLSSLTDVMIGDGENTRRMSLRSYVLAARLEEVAVVASQRLTTMSGGRYEFVHTEATVKRERRGGLGLDILDANTGAVRPTSTMSGGETFMASLSLALGLADVVSEEAGGIELETLFIDEGFGTLDPESLDMVMGVLDDLRAGGRAVGIVSHVAEMRQRIPSRLHIAKSEDGSALRTGDAVPA